MADDQVSRQRTMLATAPQTTGGATAGESVRTLSERYPGSSALYAVPSALQAADTPQPVRFTTVDQILIKVRTPGEIPVTLDRVQVLLRKRHRTRPGKDDDFSVRDMTEMMRAMSASSLLIETLLPVVALIALVVGRVGIMNIMLVSVTERTLEVGLRMAVGAQPVMIPLAQRPESMPHFRRVLTEPQAHASVDYLQLLPAAPARLGRVRFSAEMRFKHRVFGDASQPAAERHVGRSTWRTRAI